MKKLFVAIVTIIVLASHAEAGQKYNPYTGEFETVPDNYQMKYDPYDGEFSYQAPQAEQEYNPYKGTFEWNPAPAKYRKHLQDQDDCED